VLDDGDQRRREEAQDDDQPAGVEQGGRACGQHTEGHRDEPATVGMGGADDRVETDSGLLHVERVGRQLDDEGPKTLEAGEVLDPGPHDAQHGDRLGVGPRW